MRKYSEKQGKEIYKRNLKKRKNDEEYREKNREYIRGWCKKQRADSTSCSITYPLEFVNVYRQKL